MIEGGPPRLGGPDETGTGTFADSEPVPVSSGPLRGRRGAILLAGIVILGIASRAALMGPLLREKPKDPDDYLLLAESLAEGRGFRVGGRPTAYRPPLYPLLLSPGVALLGDSAGLWVALSNLLAGGVAVALTGVSARRWGFGTVPTASAMLVVALDPVLVSQARGVMTETLASALVAGFLAALGPRPTLASTALAGLVGGLCGLCRPSLLPIPLLASIAMLRFAPGTIRHRALLALVLLGTLGATLSPWAIRNARAIGATVWTTTHGGYTLYLANNPRYYDDVVIGPMAVWSGPNQDAWFAEVNRLSSGIAEHESDRLYRRLAFGVMADRPWDFARASLSRLGRFWAIAPSRAVYPRPIRWATALWTAPLWLLLIAGSCRSRARRWPRIVATTALIALSAVHCVFWTDLRMRAPVVPAIALVAAGAFAPGPGGRRT